MTQRRLVLSPQARQDLRRLQNVSQKRVVDALEKLAATGQGDVKRLRASGGEMRLRVGDVRIRFEYGDPQTADDAPSRSGPVETSDETPVVVVLRILPRGRAYR